MWILYACRCSAGLSVRSLQRDNFCLSALPSCLHAARRCAGYRVSAHFTMQCVNIYVRIIGWLSRGHSVHTTGQSLAENPVCLVERTHSRVSTITHVTIFDKREHQRSAKANAATGAAIHRSNTTLAKARFLDSRVHTQIQQRSPIPCNNSESTRPVTSVCAHAGDCRSYLAQGRIMQYNRRKQIDCSTSWQSRQSFLDILRDLCTPYFIVKYALMPWVPLRL